MSTLLIKQFLRACVDWIIYGCSHLIPRNKHIWVFIGWRFNKDREIFAENVKYMFLHAHHGEPTVRAIWIGQDKSICDLLQREGFEAYPRTSLKGTWYTLRASYVFVGALVQRHHWRLLGGGKIVQLWHGKSLKKTGYNSPYSLTRYNRFLSGNLFLKPRKFIAISEFFAQYVVSDFRVPPADVLCSGLPKHDPLFRKVPGSELDMDISLHSHMRQARAQGAAHLVLYAPTFRPTGKNPLDGIDFTSINNVLEKQNSHMFVTLHPKFSTKAWSSGTSFTRITFCESEGDVYPLLREFDVLVSDYSSLVIEFLMMRKPIILYAFDYEEYTKTMGLYSELWELVPAQKVMTGQGLVTALEDLTVNTAATEAAWEKIFTFDDGLSSARIADYLLRDDK